MTDQQRKIMNAIHHCKEVMQENNECEECKREHQNLKECLELTYEILPILDRIPLEQLKKLAVV